MTLEDIYTVIPEGTHFVVDLKDTNYGFVGHRYKGEDMTFAGQPMSEFVISTIEPDIDEYGAFLRIEVKEKDGNSLSIKQWLQGNVIR